MSDVLRITFFSVSFIMKFVKLFVLLLILACILFVLFHMKEKAWPLLEGYENVPDCQSSSTRVPSCYASVQSDDYLDFYSDAQREDYILKTQVVTPICPNDPYASMGLDLAQADDLITDASLNLTHPRWPDQERPRSSNRESDRDVSMNLMSNTYLNLSYPQAPSDPKPANTTDSSTETSSETSSKGPAPSQAATKASEPAQGSTLSNNFMLNPQATGATGSCKEDPKPTCPPCPACERCPEPQVDCKRVVKYKDQQYPVPVIADFSHFSRY